MTLDSSRRDFLVAALSLPAAVLASVAQTEAALSYRTLGKTGLKVTTVGFGCMITSDPSVIARAADVGINYFDSARGYQSGNNERMVGAALKGKRKSVVLSTKTIAKDRQTAEQHLETSLKELGTDYIDIWYLHNRASMADVPDELFEAQQAAKKAGKVRFVGVSTHSGQATLIPALVAAGKVDVILSAYNFSLDPAITQAINAASKAGVGIVAMKVMAGGFRSVKEGEKTYETLKKPGALLAALKWVISNPSVGTTIPSMTDMDQLDENLKAMSQPLSDGERKALSAHLDFIRPLYCRTCGSCAGACPQGLPVADILRYLMYAEGYGQFALGREHFLQLSAQHQAVRCEDCAGCTIQCPNGVSVRKRLARAQEVFA